MLDSLERAFALGPQLTALGADVLFTYYVQEADSQFLVRLRADGSEAWRRQHALRNVELATAQAGEIWLGAYFTHSADGLSHGVAVHRLDGNGNLLATDSAFAEALPPNSGIVGGSLTARNGELLAALVTSRGLQFADTYTVRVLRYTPEQTIAAAAWELAALPYHAYLHFPTVVYAEQGAVLGVHAAWEGGSQWLFYGIDAQGLPSGGIGPLVLAPEEAAHGLALCVQNGTVYACYTTGPVEGGESPRGVYLTGFPLSEVLAVPPVPPFLPVACDLAVYPNPFNSTCRLSFTLPTAGPVTLSLWEVTGRRVAVLASGVLDAGRRDVRWNAEGFSSGVYFARLTGPHGVLTHKLLLLR